MFMLTLIISFTVKQSSSDISDGETNIFVFNRRLQSFWMSYWWWRIKAPVESKNTFIQTLADGW